jgi:hypothetical protein
MSTSAPLKGRARQRVGISKQSMSHSTFLPQVVCVEHMGATCAAPGAKENVGAVVQNLHQHIHTAWAYAMRPSTLQHPGDPARATYVTSALQHSHGAANTLAEAASMTNTSSPAACKQLRRPPAADHTRNQAIESI